MKRREPAEVSWTVRALTAIGFSETDAARLAPLLPPIEAETLAAAERHPDPNRGWPNGVPSAVALWYSRDLGAQQARVLARQGRGLLDLIVILDAIKAARHIRLWDPASIDAACGWASERTVPRHRLAPYIAAGVSPEEAAVFEANPTTRPSTAQLRFLAALRDPM